MDEGNILKKINLVEAYTLGGVGPKWAHDQPLTYSKAVGTPPLVHTHTLPTCEYCSQQTTTPSKTTDGINCVSPPKVPRKNLLVRDLDSPTPPNKMEKLQNTSVKSPKDHQRGSRAIDSPLPYRINLCNRFDLLEEESEDEVTSAESSKHRVSHSNSRRARKRKGGQHLLQNRSQT